MELDTVELLTATRSLIASSCLDALPDAELGTVTLREDQRLLVARAERELKRQGGCIVADDVGRGKTFVALALAHRIGTPLVIVPAPLKDAWQASLKRCGMHGEVMTHNALSRGVNQPRPFDVIIVDESHHFRNANILRYGALAQLAAQAPAILLSATPLQNRVRDLAAQVALYFGAAAFELSIEWLAAFLIRSDGASEGLPNIAPPRWVSIQIDDSKLLDALLRLPDPVRTRDGGDEGALRTISLLRAWASSRAALQSVVRRRRQLAVALEQGLSEGILPSRRETRSWFAVDDAVQLGLTSFLVDGKVHAEAPQLSELLRCESTALGEISSLLKTLPDPDVLRIEALTRLRAAHSGERILAFSEFASTVRAYYASLRHLPGVGMLSSHEARIASGRISRRDLLTRFAPRAQGGESYRPHEQVTLLLTTDLLAEGLDLQDASVVVHLDLPWNPARLTQRLGRVRRPGGAIEVRSYFIAPPASVASRLHTEQLLSVKSQAATSATGSWNESLPVFTSNGLQRLLAEATASSAGASAWGTIMRLLSLWSSPTASTATPPLFIKVQASNNGWLACLTDGTLSGGGMSLVEAVRALHETDCCVRLARNDPELDMVTDWLRSMHQDALAGVRGPLGIHRSAALTHLTRLSRQLPRTQQAQAMIVISRVRAKLMQYMPLAVERQCLLLLEESTGPLIDTLYELERILASRPHERRETPTLQAAVLFARSCRSYATTSPLSPATP
jgi:superfamily II DNA or RNA helicase